MDYLSLYPVDCSSHPTWVLSSPSCGSCCTQPPHLIAVACPVASALRLHRAEIVRDGFRVGGVAIGILPLVESRAERRENPTVLKSGRRAMVCWPPMSQLLERLVAGGIAAALVTVGATSACRRASQPDAPSFTRMPDGKPNLNGVWAANNACADFIRTRLAPAEA